ncbi:hypothetical protein D3Z58_16390 [Clostridiaceae bacterium]|nr:hypothetical protein [Clostridiaceae bacterium]
MKRLAVVLGMTMLFCTPAFANEPDAVAVYQEMEEKTNNMADLDAYYDFDLDMEYQKQSIKASLKMDVKANHMDIPSECSLGADMNIGVDVSGLYEADELGPGTGMDLDDTRLNLEAKMYYADGIYYMDMMGMKFKKQVLMETMTETIEKVQSAAGQNNLDYMQDMKLRTEGDVRIISYTMNGEKMSELVNQMMDVINSAAEMDGYEDEIQVQIGDVSGEYEINSDGYYTKARLSMVMYVTESGETMKITLNGNVALRNPGQPVDLQFPDFSEFELME